jgi:hypothetical protein
MIWDTSIEQLENDYWKDYDFPTGLVRRCHEYRKIPLKDLSSEQMTTLIGQNIGRKYVVRVALENLKGDVLPDDDIYPGALFSNILKVEPEFWKVEKDLYIELRGSVDKWYHYILHSNEDNLFDDLIEQLNHFKNKAVDL